MRITQLRSFYAVARAGSFTQAAKLLHVSQPTITTQVRFLEERYNMELFHRRGRKAHLTDVGEQLFGIAKQIFSLEADAIHLLNDAGELKSGHLRVAAVGPSHVTRMLEAFTRRYPHIQVAVRMGNSQEMLDQLWDYQADVAVLAHYQADDRFFAIPYSRHPVIIFVHEKHRFAKRRSIRIRDLDGEPLIMREQGSTTRKALEEALRQAAIKPLVAMEIGSREIIREAVLKGIGIAAVSQVEYVPAPGLHAVRISDAEIYTYAHVVCLQERRQSRLVSAFIDSVSDSGIEKTTARGGN
jgi:aminoethylphosphonate catabolism LysR family transcriptional regulator